MKIGYLDRAGRRTWGVLTTTSGRIDLIAGPIADWAPDLMRTWDPSALPLTGESVPLVEARLLAPVERGNKIVVIGANYRKHLKEFGLAPDTEPVAFTKPYGSLIAHKDDIRYSPLTSQLDFEVELVVVFGKTPAPGEASLDSVLGYTIGNDISARDLQRGTPGIGMDFLSGKGMDGTTPVGAWIVTRDEFGDASPDLAMTLHVNGEQRQSGRTSDMSWDIGRLAAFVNARSALEAGDIMFTGTPPGVAQGDGRFLQEGDLVETGIERLGVLVNRVGRRPPSSSPEST